MSFVEFVLKYKRVAFIVLATAISFLLISLLGFYYWLNFHTMAQIGDYKITRRVVLDSVSKYKKYILIVNGDNANLEAETYKILLMDKAVEYEAQKKGLQISDDELVEEIKTLGTDNNPENYYKMAAASYGWDKSEAEKQVKNRMLRELLENNIVTTYGVSSFYVRSEVEPKQGESAEQIATKALEIITKARESAVSGKTLEQIKTDIIVSNPTWNGDLTHGWSEVVGLNGSNEAEKLANGKFWPAIEKLTKAGEVTDIIDATKQGGLYVFWQLNGKNAGTFKVMDDFYRSFEPRSAFNDFLIRMTPQAYAACSNWLNEHVDTAGEKAWYRVSHFHVKARDAATHALITDHSTARVVTRNIEPSSGHCDATWCNMGQNDPLGTGGETTMYNACCQFTYEVEVTGLDGHTPVHTHRSGIEGGADVTEHYPPHFNAVNGIDNMYGSIDFNPVVYTITPTAGPNCAISPATPQAVYWGGSIEFEGAIGVTGASFNGFRVDGGSLTGATRSADGRNFYGFTSVAANHTIQADCSPPPVIPTCSITATPNPAGSIGGPVTLTYTTTNAVSATWGDGTVVSPLAGGTVAGSGGNTYSIDMVSSTGDEDSCSVSVNDPAATTAILRSAVRPAGAATPAAPQSAITTSGGVTKWASFTNVNPAYNPTPTWSGGCAPNAAKTSASYAFAARSTATVTCTATFTLVTNKPLSVSLISPFDNPSGSDPIYSTTTLGGTVDVIFSAMAADADPDETINLTITYQVGGINFPSTTASQRSNNVPMVGNYPVSLPKGVYYWAASASTSNSADGIQSTAWRRLEIADPPVTPTLSCTIVPLDGSSPFVVRVDYTVTNGNGGTVYVDMGDGRGPLPTGSSPVFHTYSDAGPYNVNVTYSHDATTTGCSATVNVKDPTGGSGNEVAR